MLGKEIRVGGLDLVWDGGPVAAPCPAANACGPAPDPNRLNVYLGKQLYKTISAHTIYNGNVSLRRAGRASHWETDTLCQTLLSRKVSRSLE